MKIVAIFLISLLTVTPSFGRLNDCPEDAALLHRAQRVLTDVIIHDIFSPVGASRIYAYSNMTAYEILVLSGSPYRSLAGQIASFPTVPPAGKKVCYPLAAVYGFLLTGKALVYSDRIIADSMSQLMRGYRKERLSPAVYDASLEYGKAVSDAILGWVKKDQYAETRRMRRYVLLKDEGRWKPTPPGYMAAVEPYWNRIRTLTLDSAAQFRPPAPDRYATDSGSAFYKQAYEVYATVKQLSDEQAAIAAFWDCNPFYLNTGGHLNFATKKISPGGHWMEITRIACEQTGADISASAAAYTLASIAIFDGFISCWDEKFRSNLIRPETYINATIDENWRPPLQTPPFPEYPSGHSVISTAAAVVLTHWFGDQFAFTDHSEVRFGLPTRHFTSFRQAADEAAISRLYGGIHYRPAIENGQVQGEAIGNHVLRKIRLRGL